MTNVNHSFLRNAVMWVLGISKRMYMIFTNRILGIKKKRIVFKSFGGKSYSDNPRAISEKLHQMAPEFEIVWVFKEPNKKRKIVPHYIKCVKANSLRELKFWATSKYWVDNFTKPNYFYKRLDQIYIQTWHGDRGFKTVLSDSPASPPGRLFFESRNCNLALSSSNYADKVFKTGMLYQGELLRKGSPRNDKLLIPEEETVKDLKESLGINLDTKILLFAPTLRRVAQGNDKYQKVTGIDLVEVIDILEKKTNFNWVCLIRAHSTVNGLSDVPIDNNRFIEVTDYEEMSELLLITDFLITDYSSSAGDFALLKRPIILFQNDRKEYLKYDRNFYFNINHSPFKIAEDQDELIRLLKLFDSRLAKVNCREILEFYDTIETGKSSEAVCKYILSGF